MCSRPSCQAIPGVAASPSAGSESIVTSFHVSTSSKHRSSRKDFLDYGQILCTDVPPQLDKYVFWSGLRLTDRALVRVFKQGGGQGKVTIEAWPGCKITLTATDKGVTYVLKRAGDKVEIQERAETKDAKLD